MPIWKCLHLFSGADGISRVDSTFTKELSVIDFAPPAPPVFVVRASDAQALVFVELPVGWKGGWHASPKEQWVICLAGEMGYQAVVFEIMCRTAF
jgi:quercetin dioxygenase-like cupin family protein